MFLSVSLEVSWLVSTILVLSKEIVGGDMMLQTEFSNDGTLVSEAKVNSKLKVSASSQGQTKRGYYIDELLSALQKDIRRGNEYEAVFWAVELDGYSPWKLWDRLRVSLRGHWGR